MVEWKYNNTIIKSSQITEITTSSYNKELCGFTSTLIIRNFTTANKGQYTCTTMYKYYPIVDHSVYVAPEGI